MAGRKPKRAARAKSQAPKALAETLVVKAEDAPAMPTAAPEPVPEKPVVKMKTVYNARPALRSQFKDDEDWHYCFVEDHPVSWGLPSNIEKFEYELGYEIAQLPDGRPARTPNSAWMRIPQDIFKAREKAAEDAAAARWKRPKTPGAAVERHERKEGLAEDLASRHRSLTGSTQENR